MFCGRAWCGVRFGMMDSPTLLLHPRRPLHRVGQIFSLHLVILLSGRVSD